MYVGCARLSTAFYGAAMACATCRSDVQFVPALRSRPAGRRPQMFLRFQRLLVTCYAAQESCTVECCRHSQRNRTCVAARSSNDSEFLSAFLFSFPRMELLCLSETRRAAFRKKEDAAPGGHGPVSTAARESGLRGFWWKRWADVVQL